MQGNPLSPFIFVMVMEFLSIHLQLAPESGRIKPLKRSDQLHINHLLFADDLLIFCKADNFSAHEFNILLERLHMNTGLRINKEKSKAFFSKSCCNRSELVSILGITVSSMPSRYLGFPLTISYVKARNFSPLIDKCRSKVEGWMLKKLSPAGRIELIRSVIHNTLSYWALTFKFPISVVKEIERISSNFFWNNKMHYWSWSDICKTKPEGGLGIRRIADINEAAGIRMFWRLCTNQNLWAGWMKDRYLRNGNWDTATASLIDSGTWKFLTQSKGKASQSMHIGNSGIWEWNSGNFSFTSCWNVPRLKYPDPALLLTLLVHCPKMSMCLVRALKGKLLTRHFLKGIGITQDDTCMLCNISMETIEHLFFQCSYSTYLWEAE